jgi:hypothetical protein
MIRSLQIFYLALLATSFARKLGTDWTKLTPKDFHNFGFHKSGKHDVVSRYPIHMNINSLGGTSYYYDIQNAANAYKHAQRFCLENYDHTISSENPKNENCFWFYVPVYFRESTNHKNKDPLCIGFNMRPNIDTENKKDGTKRSTPNDFYALRVYECKLDDLRRWVPNTEGSKIKFDKKRFDETATYGERKVLAYTDLNFVNIKILCEKLSKKDDQKTAQDLLDTLGRGLAEPIRFQFIALKVQEALTSCGKVDFKEETISKLVHNWESIWSIDWVFIELIN